ncbi:hypothetical protein JW960_09915 [candidate division KSB1 bacterium]|nr:hypothetical protein [candidate division KSB1 bacterium]
MTDDKILPWLLDSDVSIQYQVHRDLLNDERPDLRQRIATEGWGADLLSRRTATGHWGRGFYQPKWTSTHYSLLELRHLNTPSVPEITETLTIILKHHKAQDGGVDPHKTLQWSDVCINGMAMNYGCYFGMPEDDFVSVVDFLLTQHMPDGGFNCYSNYKSAVHSSLHTTLSIAEGILEYANVGYTYRLDELKRAEQGCREFMLQHRLFKSDKTGAIIDKKMLMLSWPSRWRYDILRALDYFRAANVDYDTRMDDAIEVLLNKRRRDGTWPLQLKHPGQTHFDMENIGAPSLWNTLRALRVLKHFGKMENGKRRRDY